MSGLTWSTMCKQNIEWEYAFPEPQDRVDFIFYRGSLKSNRQALKKNDLQYYDLRSELYSGTEPIKIMPDQKTNDYPSDHFALFTDFEVLN